MPDDPVRRFTWIASVGSIVLAGAWAIDNLRPGSELVGPWSSDAAIPVLMSNLERFTMFEVYYLGQDRFGAVAFLLCSLVRRATGFVWTPERLFILQTVTIFASTIAVAMLARPHLMIAAAWAAILVLFPWRAHLFDLCQPYGWQLTAVLFSWVLLRLLRERALAGRPRLALFISAIAGCFVASWISSFSAPLLLCAAFAENMAVSSRARTWRTRLMIFVPVVSGGALEGILRGSYQIYANALYGRSFSTRLGLKFSGAPEAFRDVLERLDFGGAAAFYGIAILSAAAGFIAVTVARRRRFAEELPTNLVTIVGLGGISLASIVAPALISHFRANELAQKYFTLGSYASVLASALVAEMGSRQLPARAARIALVAGWTAVSIIPVVLFAWQPAAKISESFLRERRIARALAENTPGAFLVSGYWEAYNLAALAIPGVLKPYPFDGQYQRTPFLRSQLATAARIWVGTEGSDRGPLPQPGTLISVGGVLLEPSGDKPFEVEGRRFASYRSAMHHVIAHSSAAFDKCRRGARLTFSPLNRAMLLVQRRSPTSSSPSVHAFDSAGNRLQLREARVSDRLGVWALLEAAPVAEFRLESPPRDPDGGCAVTHAFVVSALGD